MDIDRRARHWLCPGDVAASLAKLEAAIDADAVNAIGRVRAAWWLRREVDLAAVYDPGSTAVARRLLAKLDLADLPAAPDLATLRGWIRDWREHRGRGALIELAGLAGVYPKQISEIRAGKPLTAEKRDLIAATIAAVGGRAA